VQRAWRGLVGERHCVEVTVVLCVAVAGLVRVVRALYIIDAARVVRRPSHAVSIIVCCTLVQREDPLHARLAPAALPRASLCGTGARLIMCTGTTPAPERLRLLQHCCHDNDQRQQRGNGVEPNQRHRDVTL